VKTRPVCKGRNIQQAQEGINVIRDLIESMAGIEIFGLLSLFIFLIIFSAVIYWTIKADKKYLDKMKNLPLDNSSMNGDVNHGQ
jgi:cbb3-type cytochrome oxidase subunit 3